MKSRIMARSANTVHEPAVGQSRHCDERHHLISKSIRPQDCPDEPVLVTTLIGTADMLRHFSASGGSSERRFQRLSDVSAHRWTKVAFSARQPHGDYQNPVRGMPITLVKTACAGGLHFENLAGWSYPPGRPRLMGLQCTGGEAGAVLRFCHGWL
jgi:hypothetical protein